jgi:hypothetical protein
MHNKVVKDFKSLESKIYKIYKNGFCIVSAQKIEQTKNSIESTLYMNNRLL